MRSKVFALFFCSYISFVCAQEAGPSGSPAKWTVIESEGRWDYTRKIKGSTALSSEVKNYMKAPPEKLRFGYLVKGEDGVWQFAADANAVNYGVEALVLDPEKKEVGLAAVGTRMNSAMAFSIICNATGDIDEDKKSIADRSRVGYQLCNSEFAKYSYDASLILAPVKVLLRLANGYSAQWISVDKAKLALAVKDVDFDVALQKISVRDEAARSKERVSNQIIAQQQQKQRQEYLRMEQEKNARELPDKTKVGAGVCQVRDVVSSIGGDSFQLMVKGYVDQVSGQKIQIRISGMQERPGSCVGSHCWIGTKNTEQLKTEKGDIYKVGAIIWDNPENWTLCN